MKKVFISHSEENRSIFHHLAERLEMEGMKVFRSDSLSYGSSINSEVLSAIRRCDIFVGILNDYNPNVLLELGYALGASKRTVLIGTEDSRIPFDIAHLRVLRVDRFSPSSIMEVIEHIRYASVTESEDPPYFKSDRDFLRAIADDPGFLDAVTPREFEEAVGRYFKELGFEARQTMDNRDGGFDFLISADEHGPAIVLVKKYNSNSRVSVSEVHRILGAAVVERASAALLVTTGGYTSSARHMAMESPIPIQLLGVEDLLAATKESITSGWR